MENQNNYGYTNPNSSYRYSGPELHQDNNTEPKKPKKSGGFGSKLAKVVVLALVFGMVAGSAFQGASWATSKFLGTDKVNVPEVTTTDNGAAGDAAAKDAKDALATSIEATAVSSATTINDVSDIVDNVMPCVVAVTNMSITEYQSWFGQVYQQESTSTGSGFIISQDEDYVYIATNNHVIEDSRELTVNFCDDAAVSGTVKGADDSADLAVVAVAISDIPAETMKAIRTASVGSSDDIRVGESAVVIGNALGYGQSVTTGVISATDRSVTFRGENGEIIENSLIQTDAAVNPGNSGGALLDMTGKVIGVVSAKYSSTAVEGMGYAIPISYAMQIINQMINNETVDAENMAYLGIAGYDVTTSLSKEHDIPSGVYVTRVVSGSAAEKAGIVPGDVITSLNGRTVSSMNAITNILKYIPAGTEIEMVICKADDDYNEQTLNVTLTRRFDSVY